MYTPVYTIQLFKSKSVLSKSRPIVFLLAGLLCLSRVVFAQNIAEPLTRLHLPIILDGIPNEPAWEVVAPFIPNQYEPENGAAATERTEFLVAYDEDYIYFALRAYDSDPKGIRANTLYRDGLSGDDHFEILLDTYNDNETAMLFTTTPAGIRKDAAISNDATGGGIRSGGWINGSFNTYWDVQTQINEAGWFAEIRVPLSSLRFQPNAQDEVIMGINLQRKVARKTERLVYPPVKRVADWAFLKPSLAKKISMQGISPSNPVYITPYVLGGVEEASSLVPAGNQYTSHTDFQREAGADIKFRLSDNFNLDITANTDFAQVEADDEQVNLTRFSLFFPEKRQFFQERAGLFDFRTGGLSRLFHSRRIGLNDDGTPVRLLGGARLIGRLGDWEMGALNMQTADSELLPSENFGVLRVRKQVFNPYSYAGGMFTSRIGVDGSSNIAYGLDGVFRLFKDDYLTLQWAETFKDDPRDGFNNVRATAELTRRTINGWGYSTLFAYAGKFYDPGIGFTLRNDFTLLDQNLSHTWLAPPESPLIWHQFALDGAAFLRNTDGTVESAELGPSWTFDLKSGAGGGLNAQMVYEDLIVPFSLSEEAEIPAGSYTFYRFGADYHVTHTSLVQLRPRIEIGSFYDGRQTTLGLSPTWYVSKHLELSSSYQFTRIVFPIRDQEFNAHLARLSIQTAVNTRLSTNAFIQYNSSFDRVSANVRFRYNLREGNDLWIVYNEGLHTNRDRFTPILPASAARTVLLKYTHTFQM